MIARILAAAFIATITASRAPAQNTTPNIDVERITARIAELREGSEVVFTAKFVCGKPILGEVAPGTYFTAVNLRNALDDTLSGATIVVTRTNGNKGVVGPVALAPFGARAGEEIDCPEIATLLKDQSGKLLKGFVEIRIPFTRELIREMIRAGISDSRDALDVVVVYTTGGS
jgi:hypothetical protein